MKNKGFTLMELLAVVVILAVIALISIPLIRGIVQKSKKGAAESSAYGYIDAVEKAIILNQINSNPELVDGEYELPINDTYKVQVKGELPTSGNLTITKSKVASATMCINNYIVKYEDNKAKVIQKCLPTPKIVDNSINATLTDGSEITTRQEFGNPIKVKFKTSLKGGKVTQVKSPEGATINESTGEVTYTTTGSELTVTFDLVGKIGNDETEGTVEVSLKDYYEKVVEADSLLKAIEEDTFENDTMAKIIVNGVTYAAHVYNYDSDLTISKDTEYGSASDAATSNTDAKNMVILKVNGNLTINNGVTLTTAKNADGYGGPKGFLIYATGTITNNGTISMTQRGAKASGQDVYLWKNTNGKYELVPSSSGTGGAQVCGNNVGIKGSDGVNRGTGAGGGGGHEAGGCSPNGAAGTSYSGGTGGGACNYWCTGVSAGSINGGIGGTGSQNSGSGAGNPAGIIYNNGSTGKRAENGTGGLLILYSNALVNNNTNSLIQSNGSKGGDASQNNAGGGGASGGGSINIFVKNTTNSNIDYTKLQATGGAGGWSSFPGGAGGVGSIAVGKIANGTYQDVYHNWSN